MRSLTRGNFKVALASLKSRRGRSLLTMFGIIVSVASVIIIAAVGQGIKDQVTGQIDHFGKDLLTIRAGRTGSSVGSFLFRSQAGATVSATDLKTVEGDTDIAMSAPLALVEGPVRGGDHQLRYNPSVVATEAGLPLLLNQTVAYGSFLSADDDSDATAVLGSEVAQDLFSEQVPLGRTFTFRGQEFTVRGIFNQFPGSSFSSEVDFNKAIFISCATAKQLTRDNINLYEILAKPRFASNIDQTARKLQTSLASAHGGNDDVVVLKQSDTIRQSDGILQLITELVVGAAAITLFVGGIGIMNIMLVTVTERMREIGLRKAVGATNRQIMSEFVSEATVLSVAGAAIGVLLAAVVVATLRVATKFVPVMQWQVVLTAAAVAILVGITFGSIPALKAAKKDPIAALRGSE